MIRIKLGLIIHYLFICFFMKKPLIFKFRDKTKFLLYDIEDVKLTNLLYYEPATFKFIMHQVKTPGFLLTSVLILVATSLELQNIVKFTQ
jgi:hypothetical protein